MVRPGGRPEGRGGAAVDSTLVIDPVSPTVGLGVLHLFCRVSPLAEAQAISDAVQKAQADGDQVIAIESLDIERYFDDGEILELERNTVFLRSGFDTQLALAGLQVNHWWTDPKGDYAPMLATV